MNYARLGGTEGLRLTRAAFAVMIKYSQLGGRLENMINEIDILESQFEGDLSVTEKLKEIRDTLKDDNDFKELMKQWNHASRMRIWISEKKLNLS